jgi:hypothetical protein
MDWRRSGEESACRRCCCCMFYVYAGAAAVTCGDADPCAAGWVAWWGMCASSFAKRKGRWSQPYETDMLYEREHGSYFGTLAGSRSGMHLAWCCSGSCPCKSRLFSH